VSTPTTTAEPVRLADVERELRQRGKALQGEAEAPIQHVRMSNLVIYCQGNETAQTIAAQIPEVVKAHPARVLLLVIDAESVDGEVTAFVEVSAQQMACTEQVILRAGEAAAGRLPFAVRSLVIGDLPTNLWWAAPQPPPLAGPFLYDLSENAQQIIYDSLGWPDPAHGVAATAAWLEQVERELCGGGWRVAADLNWRRLKYWRRLLSQTLDPASSPGAADSITEVLIEHGPHAVIQAWEIGSWLASRLGWSVDTGRVQPGREISWHFNAPQGELRLRILRLEQGAPEIHRIRIACSLAGEPTAITLVHEDGRRLSTILEGSDAAARTMMVPPHTSEELIGRQLSDRERDPVFRESMAVAQVLAQSVLE
jgi:glucose-6-phosphate dehydrogenase assembly protein OpcA